MKRIILILLAAVMCISFSGCENPIEEIIIVKKDKDENIHINISKYKWSETGINTFLPKPKSNAGYIEWDKPDSFAVHVKQTSQEDFKEYVEECEEKGFDVKFDPKLDSYFGKNGNGYSLTLRREEDNTMFIRIDKSTEYVMYETTTVVTTEKEETPVYESKSQPTLSEGIRPEFKEALDKYEEFYDEYVSILKKYNENPNDINIFGEYLECLEKLAEMSESLESLDDGEMSDEELKYYLEVTTRVTTKLLEVSQ